jgi:hypothetical protein
MNIFKVDSCPIVSAQSLTNSHVVKMILESAQLLSTAHRLLDGIETIGVSKSGRKAKRWVLPDERDSILYHATHINHPSNVWARKSNNNYNWLFCHFAALCTEYTYRYGKTHKCESELFFNTLRSPPRNIEVGYLTLMPSCMPEEYIISSDPVINYREYYNKGKKHLHSWKVREVPSWVSKEQ